MGEGLRGATPRPQGMNSWAVTLMTLGSGAGPGPAVEIRVLPCRCHQAAVALPHLARWPPSPSGRMRPALVLWPLLGRLDLGCGVFCGCLQNLLWLQFESRATEKAYPSSAEYIMRNAGLEEAQAGIMIARRNMNNLRYADGTTLDRKSTRLNSSHTLASRMPSSA